MTPEISVAEAVAILQRDPLAVYLDVRTEQEFAAGHPPGACNIPAFFFDAAHRGMPNAEFEAVVERNFPKHRLLLIGCQSGVRSRHAADMLEAHGYANVRNVAGGFGGSPLAPGWIGAGLPVEMGEPTEQSYGALKAKL